MPCVGWNAVTSARKRSGKLWKKASSTLTKATATAAPVPLLRCRAKPQVVKRSGSSSHNAGKKQGSLPATTCCRILNATVHQMDPESRRQKNKPFNDAHPVETIAAPVCTLCISHIRRAHDPRFHMVVAGISFWQDQGRKSCLCRMQGMGRYLVYTGVDPSRKYFYRSPTARKLLHLRI